MDFDQSNPNSSLVLHCKLKKCGYNYKQFPCIEFQYNNKAYQRHKYLARGTFAFCLLYRNAEDGVNVVCKVSPTTQKGKNPRIIKSKFSKEASIMSTLNHVNIVKYYDCMQTEHLRYILMEQLPYNLMDEHKRERMMSPAKVRDIMRDVFHGLQYLHHRNIVHRDIKMSNVLLTEQLHAKLCDFGEAMQLTDGETVVKITHRSGTLEYMAPELCASEGLLSTKADIWSAGVVMYSILFGSSPYACHADSEIEWRIRLCSYEMPDNWHGDPEADAAANILKNIFVGAFGERPNADQVLSDAFFLIN